MERKLLLVATLALLMVSGASAINLGVNPDTRDLGEVERGETYDLDFNLILSGTSSDVAADVSYVEASNNILQPRDSDRNYDFSSDEASHESMDSWVSFEQDRLVLDPEDYEEKNGLTIHGTVNGELTVPNDAEPGYHMFLVDLQPELADGGGITLQAVSQPTVVFRVPGRAERDIEVRSVTGLRSGDSSAQLNVEVVNTGTVTTRLRSSDLEVVDEDTGAKIADTPINSEKIAPGERRTVTANIDTSGDLEAGQYRVRGNMDYITGKAVFDDTIAIEDFIEIQPSENQTGQQTGGEGGDREALPTWLVIMVLVALGVVLYSFDIDPFWIAVLVGFTAITAFVLMTGLPTWLILIALIVTVITVYYG